MFMNVEKIINKVMEQYNDTKFNQVIAFGTS